VFCAHGLPEPTAAFPDGPSASVSTLPDTLGANHVQAQIDGVDERKDKGHPNDVSTAVKDDLSIGSPLTRREIDNACNDPNEDVCADHKSVAAETCLLGDLSC